MTPTFSGQAIFGDPTQLTASVFAGSAADEDAFLGVTAGTTQYTPCQRGPAVALLGALTGPDVPTVEAAQATLAAAANGNTGILVVPTGISPSGWDTWHDAWAAPTDLQFPASGIVEVNNQYQIGFALIIRNCKLAD
jgi:hypothetical protein